MADKLLTIVTSTYNRSELLEKNISTILSYHIEEIELIIGDNASTDDTWKMLQKYICPNVKLVHNDKNIGMANFILLGFEVKTPYYLCLNDRDYIKERDLQELLDFIRTHPDCEMIASIDGGRFSKEGYHYNTDFSIYYNLAEHPGCLVYQTEFVKKVADIAVLNGYLKEQNVIEMSCYVRTQFQYNLEIGYRRMIDYVVQPTNRDKAVPQVREEMYGVAYILPGFQISDFDALIAFAQRYSNKRKMAEILIARYRISLFKVEFEFYVSVISSDFRHRNHCDDARPSEWFKNGLQYTKAVLDNELIDQYKIKNRIKGIFVKETLINIYRILKCNFKRSITRRQNNE